MYSSHDGFVTPYHIAHLGSFAIHGAGTIMIEASGVEARGRITPDDLGIWKDEQVAGITSLVSTLKTIAAGTTVGIQLAHAGRKATTWSPYHRGPRTKRVYVTKEDNGMGWPEEVVAPSALAYDGEGGEWVVPKELTTEEVGKIHQAFLDGADRAFKAGVDFVELHAAHGYLLHSFLSPLSNTRTDKYGGSFENRTRLLVEIARDVKKKYPSKSVWVRVSSTDFAEHVEAEGKATWNIEETCKLAPLLADVGVDVLDCSAGGLVDFQKIKPGPAYQLPYAEAVSKLELPKMLTGSVGILEGDSYTGEVAEKALKDGKADLIFLARGLMAKPSWPEEAATELTGVRCAGNPAYHRVHPAKKPPPKANNTN
mgnify:CR=1 FL=1